jgi:hypothetical protein
MALTANRNLDHYVDQTLRTLKVGGGERIFKGSLVSVDSSGYAAPLAAGEKFVGIAYDEADNTAGADGAKSVKLFTEGDFQHALASIAVTDIGLPVYASADDTITKTAASNSFVGWIVDVAGTNLAIIRITPFAAAP